MAHAHHHHHGESLRDYFTEQLLTILVCGLFGFVAIELYRREMLQHILAEQFHLPVLIGGLAVLLLVVVRAVSVWREAGEAHAHDHHHHHDHDHNHDHGHHHHHNHDHKHEHGPGCDHDHAHGPGCEHDHKHNHHHQHDHGHHHHPGGDDDHGHSHDLAWVFARMLVLAFPVALFFLGIPSSGYSDERLRDMLGKDKELGEIALKEVVAKDGVVMRFGDLNDAAFDEGKRQSMEGQMAQLEGLFQRLGDKEFTLYRMKMTCCVSDTVPLKVRIITKSPVSGFKDSDWVQVKGQIQFIKSPSSNQYITVVKVAQLDDIKKVPKKNVYE